MPIAILSVSCDVLESQKLALCKKVSAMLASHLSKPEKYVMVSINQEFFTMGGTIDPAAFVDIRGIGGFSSTVNQIISLDICNEIYSTLSIPKDRIYITFSDIEAAKFGWNGGTFA